MITINSQTRFPKETLFDAFISYYEETGEDYAAKIKKCFETRNIQTFVAHIERSKLAGDYERIFDEAITNSKYFVLLITVDTLTRQQVVREVRTAYPTGLKNGPKLLIFRHNLPNIPRFTPDFIEKTGTDISKHNQLDFQHRSELATKAMTLADELLKIRTRSLDSKTKENTAEAEKLEAQFEAEIVDKKQAYVRGKDHVLFASRFRGTLTGGCFANRIIVPKIPSEVRHMDNYLFPRNTTNLNQDRRSVLSECTKTIHHWSDKTKGQLNGDIDTNWISWTWQIPEFAPLGDYKVEMNVWDTSSGIKQALVTITDSFKVIDPDDSHYSPRFRMSNAN
ncbi:MAG: toll/interleukin-1 receptor domain-containing protein [Thermoproteota archaeon]|nr:toll/interleukin-1 receptor domain-containing protein [Thermoproteota archaeon]